MNKLLPYAAKHGVMLALVLSCPEIKASPFAESARICVLVASEKDAGVIEKASTTPPRRINAAGWSIRELTLGGKKVLLGKAGRGPADASSSATAILSSSSSPWYLISATPAAGLCGQTPGQTLIAGSTSSQAASSEDAEPVDLARLFPPSVKASSESSLRTVDSFVSSDADALSIAESGYCMIDMGAHWFTLAAARASATHIPVRVISDDGGNDAGSNFREFMKNYEGTAGRAVIEIIDSLPAPANSILAHDNLVREVSDKNTTENVD